MGVSVFLSMGLEKHGDEIVRKVAVEQFQCLPQHLLGKLHLAHVETDLQGNGGEEKKRGNTVILDLVVSFHLGKFW